MPLWRNYGNSCKKSQLGSFEECFFALSDVFLLNLNKFSNGMGVAPIVL